MRRILAPALACLMTLTSCSYIANDTESLLRAPTINRQQGEVYAALEKTLDLDLITPKYPQSGENRSPYVFYDMDGDGLDEAIFFYSYTDNRASTRFKVLSRDSSGVWQHVRDIPASYGQIDFVQFANILSEKSACMIVGWQNTNAQSGQVSESYLSVYSVTGDTVTGEISDLPYISRIVHDFDGDGLEEVLTVDRDPFALTLSLSLIRPVAGRVAVTVTLPLNEQADSLMEDGAPLTAGKLWNGSGALYIDEIRSDGVCATEIIGVGSSGLTVLAGGNTPTTAELLNPEWENYTFTFRDNPVPSRDYDGDGEVEVPTEQTSLPGNLQEGEANPLMRTDLLRLTAEGMSVKHKSVINEKEGYLFFMPDIWDGWVSVMRSEDDALWRFYLLDLQDAQTSDPNIELLRIQAHGSSAEELEDMADWIPLGERGTRRYSGYIPLRTVDTPTIDERYLTESFKILP